MIHINMGGYRNQPTRPAADQIPAVPCIQQADDTARGYDVNAVVEALRKAAYDQGVAAGRKQAAADRARVVAAKRRLFARIIASAHLLAQPFTDAPEQSPWSLIKADMNALNAALKAEGGEPNAG